MNTRQKVLLIILDGLGAAPKNNGNAVVLAQPESLISYWSSSARTYLIASGEAVGLPKNVKGNSEVGHLNIGSGRTVYQSLPRINNAIAKGQLAQNNTLREAFAHAYKYGGNIHLIGLLSDGGVHSHIDHFKAVVDYFSDANFPNNLYIHAFTDGRDTPPSSALTYLSQIDRYCLDRGIGKIATIIGRYYGMDRNNKWDRTELAYDLLVKGIGAEYPTYQNALEHNYSQNITDEFIEPAVINKCKIAPNDAVILMNYRADRILQLTEALISDDFSNFHREKIENLYVAGMVEYRKNFPQKVIFPKQYINLTLGNVIDTEGKTQLRIAETEKFPHVTYFFNGGTSVIYNNEDRIIIPSPKVATYDQKPEMSALEITTILLDRISRNIYDFIVVNFANTDMVGHTGNLEAGIKAVKVVDYCVRQLVQEFTLRGGAVIITSDHGNVEEMINLDTTEVDTEHSLNPVPLIIIDGKTPSKTLPYGSLKDIAPTILDLMGISKPSDMTGQSLLRTI